MTDDDKQSLFVAEVNTLSVNTTERPTMELRFAADHGGRRILQQAWRNSDGETIWRNVPFGHAASAEEMP
jgi:hypothetical protein